MDKKQEFRFILELYLKKNTELSDKEIFIVSAFLSALTLTPVAQRYGVLRIMLKAIELIENVINNTSTIEDAIVKLNSKVSN